MGRGLVRLRREGKPGVLLGAAVPPAPGIGSFDQLVEHIARGLEAQRRFTRETAAAIRELQATP